MTFIFRIRIRRYSTNVSPKKYAYEQHYIIPNQFTELIQCHGKGILNDISKLNQTKLLIVEDKYTKDNVLLIRANNENNLQESLIQFQNVLNQEIIDIRPACLQGLIAFNIKDIKKNILNNVTQKINKNEESLDLIIDSYTSELMIRGNKIVREYAKIYINLLLSNQNLISLFIDKTIFYDQKLVSKKYFNEISKKFNVLFTKNDVNIETKFDQLLLSSTKKSKINQFLIQIINDCYVCMYNLYIIKYYNKNYK